ncbi:thiosulfate:cyanide sulfurtransferase [Gimesia panareensis]|uniref:Thiosulfate:cyanide sulfurtransferase n=1 Tax=Gimesia panareensis TaxID=2527978 RepID=A0A517Q8M5_9PLAN|nr:rhodanese-like domain-containing protein [Gimesia panareensis]QDT28002.1 thiosulfate:cyanide sulfurtransferase [Gimesia panareensis]
MLTISRKELQELLVSCPDLKLVEVLSETDFQKFHLQGAINIPLGDFFCEQILQEIPDKTQTVVVYSLNYECKYSEQATQQMLQLGYQRVYDYEPGKIDWIAAHLPTEYGHHITNRSEIP